MQDLSDDLSKSLVELFASACSAIDIETLSTSILPFLIRLEGTDAGFVYIGDARFTRPAFSAAGGRAEMREALETHAPNWFDRRASQEVTLPSALAENFDDANVHIYPLIREDRVLGIFGLLGCSRDADRWSPVLRQRVADILSHVIDRLAGELSSARRLNRLSAYARVSSMLGRSGDLGELLEIALYSSMEAVSGEAASVLLLDERKENFRFYNVEGTAEPLLSGACFPATEGFAGHVLETMEAEVVNDVSSDPRFYGQIDLASGFETRNLVAVPLIAGDERIGVLEVLNRKDGKDFTPGDRLLLSSVADEMAFAIRNAAVFDFLASEYCRRRQGDTTCDACERPIEAWVPCGRYRR